LYKVILIHVIQYLYISISKGDRVAPLLCPKDFIFRRKKESSSKEKEIAPSPQTSTSEATSRFRKIGERAN
jgi:hypothetical protein